MKLIIQKNKAPFWRMMIYERPSLGKTQQDPDIYTRFRSRKLWENF